MKTMLRVSFTFLLLMTALTGVVYPVATTLIAQAVFPSQANGSLLVRGGEPVGSALIGQEFTRPEYFWGRLSATGGAPYNPMASGGTNYGALHPGVVEAATTRLAALRAADPQGGKAVPLDLLTASASGLDPHISVKAAEHQADRVAAARGVPAEQVRALIRKHTEGEFLGFSGIAHVNVLKLNLALDRP